MDCQPNIFEGSGSLLTFIKYTQKVSQHETDFDLPFNMIVKSISVLVKLKLLGVFFLFDLL